ncbi:MAG: alpha/beta hydrolase-fold protein [bacterium]|jgi:enterochelin esterase family protein
MFAGKRKSWFGSALIPLVLAAVIAGASGAAPAEEEILSPKIANLYKMLDEARPGEMDAIVSAFIEENRERFPLVEENLATFVYYGRVGLRVTVPSDLNRWDTKMHEMTRLKDTDLFYLTLELPGDARIDYKFYVDTVWMLDPMNPETITGGFGPNSELSMPGYVFPAEIEPNDTIPHGTIEVHNFDSKIMANSRNIHVYTPAGYDEGGSYHTVFVQDGSEYISLGSMVDVLDNIIYQGRIPPVVAVFVDPVDRNFEYWANPDYERTVVEEIVPFVRANYAVAEEPARNAIMGASLGGAISLFISADHPDLFGKCGSQSGAFGLDGGKLYDKMEKMDRVPVDFYLDTGLIGDLDTDNVRMKDVLEMKGYNILYREFNEGHSWGNWRAHIDDMLVFFWGEEAK